MHPSSFPQLTSGSVQYCGNAVRDKTDIQTAATTIHFASAMPHANEPWEVAVFSRRELIVADRWSRMAVMACVEAAERCVSRDSNVRAETLQGTDRPSALLAHAEIHSIRAFITASLSLQVTLRPMLWDRCPVCLSVCLSVTLVYCDQTVEWIKTCHLVRR